MPVMDNVAARARRLLSSTPAGAAGGASESSSARAGPPDAADAQAIARQLKRVRRETAAAPSDSSDLDRLAASLVERAQAAMKALEHGASPGTLTDDDTAALESVIRTRGRPALAIEWPRIQPIDSVRHPGSDFWRIPLNDHETQLVRVAGAAGAVTSRDTVTGAPAHVRGTAWLIRADLVVTNRHVIFPDTGPRLAKRGAGRPTDAALKPDFELMIDFAFDDGPARADRCLVTGVAYISEDSDPVDVAILRIAGTPADGVPLTVARAAGTSTQLYLFGHPGRLNGVPDEVQAVFGTPDGRKRVCFGQVMPADPAHPSEMAHDASTIGGFSGGCVLTFGSTDVGGLHYYGDPVRGNRAITAQALLAHPVGAFL